MRVYYTLRHLLRSHQVTLYAMDSRVNLNGSRHSGLAGLQQKIFSMGKAAYAWNGLRGLFSNLPLQVKLYECPRFAQTLDADIRSGAFDVLMVHLVRMAEYVRPYHHLPRILDMADSIYLHYARMQKVWWSPIWLGARMDRDRIRRYEAEATHWFDRVLVHTEEDLEWVREQSGARNLVQSAMGVDTDEFAFQAKVHNPRCIVYCGKLDYLPNTDAALYFANEIFPLVRQQIPEAQFRIVGLNPPRALRALAQTPGIEIHANVPDIRPEVSSAAVSVAPIRFGAGIQNKILQALSMGVPVVATPLAAKPFGDPTCSPVLAAANPREFSNHVIKIIQDTGYRGRLAHAGRAMIKTNFGWEKVLAPLDDFLAQPFNAKKESS